MKDGLSSCQKACVVKCTASQVLKYSSNLETKTAGIADIYDKRLGECTEFSSVATDLGKALGVEVKGMSGPEQLNSRREIGKGTEIDDGARRVGKGTSVRIE